MEPGRANRDYFSDMARENVAGKRIQTILGNNSSLNTLRPVWDDDSDYVFPTVAAIFNLSSADPNDTIAGTGAQKVQVTYLDADYVEKILVLDMNGTTNVPLPETALRVNSLVVTQVGTGGKNVGKISIKNGSNTLYIIRVGENTSDGCIFTVPKGKEIVVYAPSSSVSSGTEADIFIEFTRGAGGPRFLRKAHSVFEAQNSGDISKPVQRLPEKSDLSILAMKVIGGPTPSISTAFQIEIHELGQ